MKKLTTLFILAFLAVGLFAEPVIIPKNTDAITIDKTIYYCDDSFEYEYKIYSIVYQTDLINLINLNATKKSLNNDTLISITVKFNTEPELDSFLDYFFYQYDFQKKDTPEYFDELKEFITELGVEPYYTLDESNKPKQILYIANLSRKQ